MPHAIATANAPQFELPFSQAVRSGNLVFLSGITPFTLEQTLAKGDFPAQMHQTMTNVGAILAAAGSGFDRVVKCTVILARREDWGAMNGIYEQYFPAEKYPARTAFQGLLPHPDFLLEIECVASRDDVMTDLDPSSSTTPRFPPRRAVNAAITELTKDMPNWWDVGPPGCATRGPRRGPFPAVEKSPARGRSRSTGRRADPTRVIAPGVRGVYLHFHGGGWCSARATSRTVSSSASPMRPGSRR